jgi:hypothetical protein
VVVVVVRRGKGDRLSSSKMARVRRSPMERQFWMVAAKKEVAERERALRLGSGRWCVVMKVWGSRACVMGDRRVLR